MALADADAVLMRKDPPFDSEYFYATHLLSQAEREGARVFNSPQALREHPEKLAILEFPKYIAATIVTRDEAAIKRFHAEHKDPADNDACLARIQKAKSWRKELGPEAEVGGFIGRPDQWRRVSEVWVDPDLSDDGIAWEIAARLTDYIVAIEPRR